MLPAGSRKYQKKFDPIQWRPILVGGVFNAVNQDVYERRANPDPRKSIYYEKDLQDWARFCGIKIGRPPVFPVRAVAAMRAVIAADEKGALVPFARATNRRPDFAQRSRSPKATQGRLRAKRGGGTQCPHEKSPPPSSAKPTRGGGSVPSL